MAFLQHDDDDQQHQQSGSHWPSAAHKSALPFPCPINLSSALCDSKCRHYTHNCRTTFIELEVRLFIFDNGTGNAQNCSKSRPKKDEYVSSSLDTFFRHLNLTQCPTWFTSSPSPRTSNNGLWKQIGSQEKRPSNTFLHSAFLDAR